MTEDVYSKLQKHLDTFVLSAPESDALLEILRIRFSPEEAEAALVLDQIAKDVPTLAKSAGMDEETLRSILEQMADKALVFKRTRTIDGAGKDVYVEQAIIQTGVGSDAYFAAVQL